MHFVKPLRDLVGRRIDSVSLGPDALVRTMARIVDVEERR